MYGSFINSLPYVSFESCPKNVLFPSSLVHFRLLVCPFSSSRVEDEFGFLLPGQV